MCARPKQYFVRIEVNMSDAKTKLRIKLGGGELEFEGSEQFLKDEVMPTIEKLLDLVGSRSDLRAPSLPIETNGALIQLPSESVASAHSTTTMEHSTSTIAALLKATAAADLAIAAVAHLVLGQKKDRVSRDDIHAEMKNASAFYKSNMQNNLSNTLRGLVKAGRLHEVATDTYSLPHNERTLLEAELAEAH
jgi:hypothetical protein